MAFGTLGGDIKAAPEIIEVTLPNATTEDTDVFMLGGSQNGSELVVEATTDISSAGAVTVTLSHADSEANAVYGNTVGSSEVLLAVTSGSWSDGDVMIRYAPASDIGSYGTLRFDCASDLSSDTVEVYQRPTC